jgi:hypothetical protein
VLPRKVFIPGSTRLGAAVSLLSIIYKFEDFKCDDIYVALKKP